MRIKTKLAKLAPFFQSAVVISISALFVVSIVYAATTIGSSITTGGNLTVTGWASSTSATTTSYLYIGADGTEPNPWNFQGGDLYVQDDVFMGSQATSVASLWVGSAGTADNLNLTGGDLYVQDGIEADGGLWVNAATTTDSLAVTGDLLAKGGTYNFTTTTGTTTLGLFVFGNTGTGTTTLGVGSATQKGCIELTGGDALYYRIIVDAGVLNVVLGRCN